MSLRHLCLVALLLAGCSVSTPSDLPEEPAESASSEPIHVLPTGDCYAMAFSPDNRFLAIVRNGPLQVWDVNRRTMVAEASEFHIKHLVWSPDGTRLVTSVERAMLGEPAWLRLWEFRDESRLEQVGAVTAWPPSAVAFTADGRVFAPGAAGKIREGPAADRLNFIAKDADAIGPARDRFVSVGLDGSLRRYDGDGKLLAAPLGNVPPSVMFMSRVSFASGVGRVALSDDHCLCAKDVATGRQLFRTVMPGSHAEIAYSPDGRVLAVSRWLGGMALLNGATGSVRGWWKDADQPAFSPDGTLIAWQEGKTIVIRRTAEAIAGAADPPTEPAIAAGPLQAELVSKKSTYVLDPATVVMDSAVTGRMQPQTVDMEFRIRNVGVADVLVDPDGRVKAFLHGDGAINASWEAQVGDPGDKRDPIRLAPGAEFRVPVRELRGFLARSYWTLPGKYLVHASYQMVLPVKGDIEWSELESRPIEVTVIAP